MKSMYSPALTWLVNTGRSDSDDSTSCNNQCIHWDFPPSTTSGDVVNTVKASYAHSHGSGKTPLHHSVRVVLSSQAECLKYRRHDGDSQIPHLVSVHMNAWITLNGPCVTETHPCTDSKSCTVLKTDGHNTNCFVL